MKIITIIACVITLSSTVFAESIADKYFESKEECEQACHALLTETANQSFSAVIEEFSDKTNTAEKNATLVTMLDLLKEKGGEFECVQKVGEKQLGDLYFKMGYIVKYQETAIFFEFVVLRSNKGYQPKLSDIEVNPKTSKLLEKIPDYCWK